MVVVFEVGRNRAIAIAESLARAISKRFESPALVDSRMLKICHPEHRSLVLIDPASIVLRSESRD